MEKQPVEFLGRRITQLLADSRAELGKYLGTSGDNLIYTQNVTVSLNIVARSLELGTGDEVLTTNHEYGAVDRTWRFLSKERGFTYVNQPITTPLTTAEKFVEDVWSGVTPRTRVICLSHITSPTAIIFPIREIIQRAREKGIITVVDGAHVAGQIPLHLDSLGADFYGGNSYNGKCPPIPPWAQAHLQEAPAVSMNYRATYPCLLATDAPHTNYSGNCAIRNMKSLKVVLPVRTAMAITTVAVERDIAALQVMNEKTIPAAARFHRLPWRTYLRH